MKKIGLHPFFLIFGIFLIIFGQAYLFLTYLLVAILHEFGHALVAKKMGYELSNFFLMPYGAGLSFNQNFVDEKDEIIIALSGPATNFLLAIFTISLWWIFPEIYSSTELFVFANITTGALNLLPCFPLDGGRILTALLTLKNHKRKKSLKFCFIFNYLISLCFFIVFLINIFQNLTFLIFAIFIFLGTFDLKLSGNYTLKNFPFFENDLAKLKHIQINQFAISPNTQLFEIAKHLKKNKLNLIYVIFENNMKILTEKKIINFFEKYPANTKIKNLLK